MSQHLIVITQDDYQFFEWVDELLLRGSAHQEKGLPMATNAPSNPVDVVASGVQDAVKNLEQTADALENSGIKELQTVQDTSVDTVLALVKTAQLALDHALKFVPLLGAATGASSGPGQPAI